MVNILEEEPHSRVELVFRRLYLGKHLRRALRSVTVIKAGRRRPGLPFHREEKPFSRSYS